MIRLSSILCLLSISSLAYTQVIVPRMLGGEPVDIGNFPYQISLQENGRPTCGGGIIGKRFILTAAHCVVDKERKLYSPKFNVVTGTTDLKNSAKDLSVEVETVYIPKSYRPSHSADDIAVLKLKQDLDLSRGLEILNLPNDDQNYVGQVAKVAGYGLIWLRKSNTGFTDRVLRYLNVKIISNDECRWQFRNLANNTKQLIHDSNICGQALPRIAGYPAGVCSGDSGSPLVIGNTVIGVANRAGSTSCREDKLAARYSRVSSFLRFVKNALRGVITVGMKKYNLTANAEVTHDIYYPEDKK